MYSLPTPSLVPTVEADPALSMATDGTRLATAQLKHRRQSAPTGAPNRRACGVHAVTDDVGPCGRGPKPQERLLLLPLQHQ